VRRSFGRSHLLVLTLVGIVLAAGDSSALSAAEAVDCGRADTLCVATVAGDQQEFGTIQAAVNRARAGDTVVVFAGDYAGFRVTRSGKANRRIVIRGRAGARITTPESGGDEGIYLRRVSFVTVRGFDIRAEGMRRGIAARDARAAKPARGLEILDNVVTGAESTNIYLSHVADSLVAGNVAANSQGSHGIYLANAGSDDTELRGNICYGNAKNGIHFNGDASFGGDGVHTGLIVDGNFLFDNVDNGLDADGVRDSSFVNNVIYANGRHGLRAFAIDAAAGPANLVIANNTFDNNKGWAVKLSEDGGGHAIFNNILLSKSGSLTVDAELDADYNVGTRYSLDGGDTEVGLAGWRAAGHGARGPRGGGAMNLYQDVLFRGLDVLRGRRNVARLKFLRRSQYWSPEQLQQWQLQRLNELLAHAVVASPYYRERLAGLRLPLRGLKELRVLPVLGREDIREHRERIKTVGLPSSRYIWARTGGSTGEPTHYYWDKRGQDWNRASVYRSAEWAGTELGDRALQMSIAQVDRSAAQRLPKRLSNWLLRYRDWSAAAPTESDFDDYRQQLLSFRPASVWGYAGTLAAFAAYVESQYPGDRYASVRAVITSSETLRDEQRERIERVFGTGTVFDHYGSREMYLAAECSAHDGYHVNAEVLILEVVDGEGNPCLPGQSGRVLATDLSNHAFPFVRYEIGDMAVAAPETPCACGVTLPRIQRVDGRISDLVALRDRIVTPQTFCMIFSTVRGVRQFQVRQDERDRLRVLLETNDEYGAEDESYITESLTQMVGSDTAIELVTDEPIVVPESGKRRFVVSSIAAGSP